MKHGVTLFIYLFIVSVFFIVNDYMETPKYMVASKFSNDHITAEKYKAVKSLSYISFKVFPLCNYAILPTTEEVCEAILLKPFQFVRRILNDVSSITKAPSLQC
jgi:hypothetical protein